MRQEHLPSLRGTYQTLENAAVDLYGFAVACHGGAQWLAEPDLLEVLLLGLENAWFSEGPTGEIAHTEFREELFQALWKKCRGRESPPRIGTEVPLGHEEMRFYQLPQLARAALYLRTRRQFSYAAIALTLELDEGVVRAEVEHAREFLLGRRLRPLDYAEEDF